MDPVRTQGGEEATALRASAHPAKTTARILPAQSAVRPAMHEHNHFFSGSARRTITGTEPAADADRLPALQFTRVFRRRPLRVDAT